MSLRQHDELPVDDAGQALHALARQKVQLAMAALGQRPAVEPVPEAVAQVAAPVADAPAAVAPGEEDVVLQQALDRMHEQLGDVCALDRDGRELSWRELAEIVIGPMGARSRDADTAAALLMAIRPEDTSPDHIYADLVAERDEGHDVVRSEHATLGNGGHRYVFRASEDPQSAEAVRAGEERLLSVLERRYPDPAAPSPTTDR